MFYFHICNTLFLNCFRNGEMIREHYGWRLIVEHSDDTGNSYQEKSFIEFHFADMDTMTMQNEPDTDAKAIRVLSSKKANMVIIY